MMRVGTLGWLAAHELRLSWRDWLSMMTAGNTARACWAYVGVAVFVGLLHLLAYGVLVDRLPPVGGYSVSMLSVLSITLALSFFMMMSQAMEHVTRAFYARADMELILASPFDSRQVFAVRIAAIAVSTAVMALLLAMPFINVAVILDGPRWLAAYAVVSAAAAVATALSVLLTVAMFAVIGPRRTRLAAQISAAIVGAGFIIGLQIMAIMMGGSMSRLDVLSSPVVVSLMPDMQSAFWWPARALMGEALPLLVLVCGGLLALGLVISGAADRFRTLVIAVAGISEQERGSGAGVRWTMRPSSPIAMLRQKEWRLLARDPWLVSQTLMQILYLLPPAVLLWQSYGDTAGFIVVLAPVLVMALGQLAGGLAWLAVSGEDAPDLIAAAPIPVGLAIRAKIEAVMLLVALVALPFLLALMVMAPLSALIVGVGVFAAAGQAVVIQLWFRAPASRSQFRRRQTASKVATFAEAFSSVAWAGATCLAAVQSWLALIFIAVALVVLGLARAAAPAQRPSSHQAM